MSKWLCRLYKFLTYRLKKPSITVAEAMLCGDNSFVYVRYFLSRPDKIKDNSEVYLENEATGEKLILMNFVRFGKVKTKHNRHQPYGILIFRNIDEIIEKDSIVTLVFDELKHEHVKIK